jgi:hypothetical protein
MTLINPGTPGSRFQILSDLAKNVGRRLAIDLVPYDVSVTSDSSEDTHWMYRFDAYENRIYRVKHGFQRFCEIDIGNDSLLDLDDLEVQIQHALLELNQKAL